MYRFYIECKVCFVQETEVDERRMWYEYVLYIDVWNVKVCACLIDVAVYVHRCRVYRGVYRSHKL